MKSNMMIRIVRDFDLNLINIILAYVSISVS